MIHSPLHMRDYHIHSCVQREERLSLSARAPYRLILRCEIPTDPLLAAEGLKVLRKLTARIDALTEAKKESEGETVQ